MLKYLLSLQEIILISHPDNSSQYKFTSNLKLLNVI